MNAVQIQLQWIEEAKVLKSLAILCAAMFLVGVAALPDVYRRHHSTRWPTTTGTVEMTGLEVSFQKPHLPTRYKASVCYRYKVDGILHAGTRINFADSYPTFEKDAGWAWLHQAYPIGMSVRVHYDPTDPDFAVLEPGATDLVWIIRFWLGTMTCCVLLAVFLSRRARNKTVASIEG